MNSHLPSMSPKNEMPYGRSEKWLENINDLIKNIKDIKDEDIKKNFFGGIIKTYPYIGCYGFSNQLKELGVLLGIGEIGTGHCVLVTGARGIGKTTLVNQAIYNSSLLGRGDLYISENKIIKQSDRIDIRIDNLNKIFMDSVNHNSSIIIKPKEDNINLLIDVRITIANHIEVEQLLKRVIRKFYATLVEYGIAGLAPELVKEARWAYIRTYDLSLEHIEKIKSTLDVNINGTTSINGLAVKLGINAKEEIDNARKIIASLPQASLEDNEDNLVSLLSKINSKEFNTQDGMISKIEKISDSIKSVYKNFTFGIKQSFTGLPNISTNVVFVFDELDKLTLGKKNKDNTLDNNIDEHLVKNLIDVVIGLKQVLIAGKASFIFISNKETALEWTKEKYLDSSKQILRTMFSDHIHLTALSLKSARSILEFYCQSENILEVSIKNFIKLQYKQKWIDIEEDFNITIEGKKINIYEFLACSFMWSSNGNTKNYLLTIRNFIKQFGLIYKENSVKNINMYFEKIHMDYLKGIVIDKQFSEDWFLELSAINETYETVIKDSLEPIYLNILIYKDEFDDKNMNKNSLEKELTLSDFIANTVIISLEKGIYKDQAKKINDQLEKYFDNKDSNLYYQRDKWVYEEYKEEIASSVERILIKNIIMIETAIENYNKVKENSKVKLFKKLFKKLSDDDIVREVSK